MPYIIRMSSDNLTGRSITDNTTGEFKQILQAPIKSDFAGTLPYLIVISIAMLSGTFGNCLVITSVVKHKDLRTVGNIFIVNLALADLCVTAFVDPFSIIGILFGEQWFIDKPRLCEFVGYICIASCLCSVLSIGAISFNRYIHICHDYLYKKIYTLRNTTFMGIGLWIMASLMGISSFFEWGDYVYDTTILSCAWDRTADHSYTYFIIFIGVMFPASLTCVCYLKIFLFVMKNKRKVGQMRSRVNKEQDADKSKEKRESVRLARTLFLIFVLFILCWLPYAIVALAGLYDTFSPAIHSYTLAIAHVNSSINCIVYGVTNKQFRNSYIDILRLKKCLKRQIEPGMPMTDSVTATNKQSVTAITVTG